MDDDWELSVKYELLILCETIQDIKHPASIILATKHSNRKDKLVVKQGKRDHF